MKNYVYIYFNKGMRDNVTPDSVKQEWMSWFGELGDKLVDGGNPFGPDAKAVNKDGIMDVKDMPATGYSIVKAESYDEAASWAKNCPVLNEPGGAVCIYETMPM